jgi:hypothetical protein
MPGSFPGPGAANAIVRLLRERGLVQNCWTSGALHGILRDGMHGHHDHPYLLQTAAFFVALVPVVLLFAVMAGARFFDRIHVQNSSV